METSTKYGWGPGIVAIVVAAFALAMVFVACSNGDDSDAMSRLNASISAQNAQIEALTTQVGDLQSELAGQADLRASITELRQQMEADGDDDNMMDTGRIDDLSADLEGINASVSELQNWMDEDGEDDERIDMEHIDNLAAELAAFGTALAELQTRMDKDDERIDSERIGNFSAELAGVRDALMEIRNSADSTELDAAISRLDWLEHALGPAYTRSYVEQAIRRYKSEGRQATLDYYNTMDSVSGDLYLFVLDEQYQLIVHPTVPANIGMDIRGPLGTDITGKNYGAEMVTADESGKWVDYVYLNPADDFDYERKHSWVVRHENLIFGSGWYERDVALESAPATYARALVEQAVARYDAVGHDAAIVHYNSPDSVDGQYYVFIGDENDVMIAHAAVPENVGKHFDDIISPDGYLAGAQVAAAAVEGGAWTTYTYLNTSTGNVETKHSWVTRHDGMIFGSGWYEEGPPKSDAAGYARSLVQRAVNLYDGLGKDRTVDYYNAPESVGGQWYVFIIDENDLFLSHAVSPSLLGTDLKAVVGSDGYELGKEIAKASEDGHWVEYLWSNPATDAEETKRSWVIRHNGLIFGSGYYGK